MVRHLRHRGDWEGYENMRNWIWLAWLRVLGFFTVPPTRRVRYRWEQVILLAVAFLVIWTLVQTIPSVKSLATWVITQVQTVLGNILNNGA